MRIIPILVYLLFIPLTVYGQFSSNTTEQIDTVKNNNAVDITLDPVSSVKINNHVGGFALQSGASKELEESTVTSTELGYVSGVTSALQGQIDGKQDSLPLSTDGDILFYNAGFAALPIGTAGQVLTVNGSLLPEWQDVIAVSVTTKGDVQTHNGTDPDRLAVGSNGQLLSANSATLTGLEWIDPPLSSPTTTIGDLIYNNTGTGSGDTRLPIGSEDQLLTVKSGVPSWEDAPVSTTLTTKGDIQTYDTANARLPVGLDGQFIVADSAEVTGLKWSDTLQGKLNPITDFQDYPVVFQSGGNNLTVNKLRYKQIGDEIIIEFEALYTSTSSDINLAIRFPDGFLIDSNKIRHLAGVSEYFDSSVNDHLYVANDVRTDGTGTYFQLLRSSIAGGAPPIASGDKISAVLRAKIQGLSSGLDAVVKPASPPYSLIAYRPSTQALLDGVLTKIQYSTEIEEIGGDLYSSGTFTCPEAGKKYQANFNVYLETFDLDNTTLVIKIVNSIGENYELARSRTSTTNGLAQNIGGGRVLNCISQGQTFEFSAVCNTGDSSNCITRAEVGSEKFLNLSIHEIVDDNVIAGVFEQIESDTVDYITYRGTGTQTIADGSTEKVSLQNIETSSGATASGGDVTINKDGLYFLSGMVGFANAAGTNNRVVCEIKINGANKSIFRGSGNANGASTIDCGQAALQLFEGDIVNLHFTNNTGTAQALRTGDNESSLNVFEIPNTETIVKNLNDNNNTECQTKILSADITSDTNPIGDLTFSGLDIGICHKLVLSPAFYVINGDLGVFFQGVNDSIVVGRASQGNRGTGPKDARISTISYFEPTSNTLTVSSSSMSSGTLIQGNGSVGETYVTLCQMPDNFICNSNKWD